MGKCLIIKGADFSLNGINNHSNEVELVVNGTYGFQKTMLDGTTSVVTIGESGTYNLGRNYKELNFGSETATRENVTGIKVRNIYPLESVGLSRCSSLSIIDLSEMTPNPSACNLGFYETRFSSLSLPSSPIKATIIQSMFYKAMATNAVNILDLKSIDVSNTSNANTAFFYCGARRIDISTWDTSHWDRCAGLFQSSIYLQELNMDNCELSQITAASYRSNVFASCQSLQKITVANCSQATKSWLIARLAEAGYTFTESSAGVLTKS